MLHAGAFRAVFIATAAVVEIIDGFRRLFHIVEKFIAWNSHHAFRLALLEAVVERRASQTHCNDQLAATQIMLRWQRNQGSF